ncbi:MAG TPA: amidohydrolase family protein [Xanthobacteraceae bacterium]|nr:amidohydrolase family protein [Xanthobacteraceae bacterium]
MPAGAVDTHAHVIGLPPRYPLVAERSYTAPEASPAAYLAMLDATHMAHGVLVQPSVHGTDNRLLTDAMRAAKGRLRGICVVAPDVSERELAELAAAHIVGCRLNVLFGGGIGLDAIDTLARKVKPFGWHLQLLMDVRAIAPIAGSLAKLPVPWVIDHMGYVLANEALENQGFQTMLKLLRDSDGWVKLSGAYRVSAGPPYADTIAMAQALVAARPDRLVWGSDWPHVSHKGPMPNVGDILDLLADWVRDAAMRDRILADNAHRLYGFSR